MGVIPVGGMIWRPSCFSYQTKVLKSPPLHLWKIRPSDWFLSDPQVLPMTMKTRMSRDSGVDLPLISVFASIAFYFCIFVVRSSIRSCVGTFWIFYMIHIRLHDHWGMKSFKWYQSHRLGCRWFYNIKIWVFRWFQFECTWFVLNFDITHLNIYIHWI